MVDLVKIRRKAREKNEPEKTTGNTPKVDESTPAEPLPEAKPDGATEPKPRRTGSEKPSKAETKAEKEPQSAKKEPSKPRTRAAADPKEKDSEKPEPTPKKSEEPKAEPQEERAVTAAPVEPKVAPKQEEEVGEEVLDRLERFKREAGKRRSWVASAKGTTGALEDEVATGLELLRFRLAGEEYAVDIEKIVEIVPPRATTRVPNADRAIVGIMSLRGTIVTVFDLRSKLGHPPIGAGQDAERRMIVVEREGETAGFIVDKVSRVVKLDPSELENHPVVSAAEQSDYVGGVFQASDGLVILLDLEKILASHT